ncbi:CHY zinc finger protein [Brachybacterium sp. GCM10030267]|uniref:CHY zinc finger protein n=1 Tax=unclassified Brachybacterium TaxID=2623841 RepID=UPI003616A8E0
MNEPEATVPVVHGPTADAQTRCIHYGTALDVIAIRFACCGEYYPCHLCHEETAGHASFPWPAGSRGEQAILCGVCWSELTIDEYVESSNRCPRCGAGSNPGCALHHHMYFE